MVKRQFLVLRIIADHYLNYSGHEKVIHSFEKVFLGSSLDSCVDYLFTCYDGRFRIMCRSNKKLVAILNCKLENNNLIFE